MNVPADLPGEAMGRAGNGDLSLAQLLDDLADSGLKACLYRDAYRMAMADGTVKPGEKKVLEDIARELGIEPPDALEIQDVVDADLDLRLRFSRLVKKLSDSD
jgi:uncharacterized tellurite resistance protein B-like protein